MSEVLIKAILEGSGLPGPPSNQSHVPLMAPVDASFPGPSFAVHPNPAEHPNREGCRPQLLGATLPTQGRLFTHGQGPEAGQHGETTQISSREWHGHIKPRPETRFRLVRTGLRRENRAEEGSLADQRSTGLQSQAPSGTLLH